MKLHLPKQLFTALLAAITLAAPAALTLGSSVGAADELGIVREGNFWANDYTYSFMLQDDAFTNVIADANGAKAIVLSRYYGSSETGDLGSNALIAVQDSAGTITLKLGRGQYTSASDSFLPQSQNCVSFDTDVTVKTGVVYTLKVTGATGSMTPTLYGIAAGESDTQSSYNGNMNGNTNSMNSVFNDNDAILISGSSFVASDDSSTNNVVEGTASLVENNTLVWAGTPAEGAAAWTAESTTWNNISGSANGVAAGAANDVIFDASSATSKTVNLGGSLAVNSISVYGDYTLNATAATTLSTTEGLSIAGGKTLTLQGATITLGGTITNNGTLNMAGFTVAANTTTTFGGSGTTTLSGTITNNGTLNMSSFTVAADTEATFSGTGTTALAGTVTNNGTLNMSGFTVAADTEATFSGTGTTTLTGAITNNASLILSEDVVWNSGATVSNNGTLQINKGTGDLVLNNIVDVNAGTYRQAVVTNTAAGNLIIVNTGNKSLSGDITISNGGKVTLKGGTFGTADAAITNNIAAENSTTLVLDGVVAYLNKADSVDQILDINTELTNGSVMHMLADDRLNWGGSYTTTVGLNSLLDVGSTRQSLSGNTLKLAGGTIYGTGGMYPDGNYTAGLDYHASGTITVTENSLIATAVASRETDDVVTLDVAANKTLTIGSYTAGETTNTGSFVGAGKFDKTGDGTVLYKGSAFTNTLDIKAGVFEYYVEDERTHTGSITDSGTTSGDTTAYNGTFKKSGAGTLTLTNATVTKLNVAGGKLVYELADNAEAEVDHTLASFVVSSGATFEKTGAGTLNAGNLVNGTFSGGIVVNEGVLQFNGFAKGTTTEDNAVVPPRFVQLVQNLTTTGTGKVDITGRVSFNWTGTHDGVRACTIGSNISVEDDLQMNSHASNADADGDTMCRWEVVSGGTLEVGGKLWLTNKQKLVVDGGAVTAAGGVHLGHNENNGNYYSKIAMESGSLTTQNITLIGNNNAVQMTGGTITFTPAADGGEVLIDGDTSSSSAGAGTLDFAGGTLAATTNSWTLTGTSAMVVSLGNVEFNIAAGKTVTLAGIYNLTSTLGLTSNTETDGETTTYGKLALTGTMKVDSLGVLTEQPGGTYKDLEGNEAVNGFRAGQYYLVDNQHDDTGRTPITIEGLEVMVGNVSMTNNVSVTTSGDLVLTLDSGGAYYANSGTVEAADAISSVTSFTGYIVQSGAELSITPGDSLSTTNAQNALLATTGSGTISLNGNLAIAAGSVSKATGKLAITSGAALIMDAGDGSTGGVQHKTHQYNLSSFSSVELDGGTIQYHGAATTLNNVTVTEKGAHITFRDVNNLSNAMTLAGTTTLNGTLKLDTLSNDPDTTINAWKYGVDIARLTGSGTLDIHSTDYSGNGGETARVSIQELSGFTGNISLSKHVGPAQLNLNNLSGTLGLKTIAMAGGAQTTLNVNADTEATMATVISGNGSVTKQGAGKLTLSGASSYTGTTTVSAGELALAAGASLGSGTVTVASGASLSLGENATLSLSSGTSSLGTLTAGTGSKINLAEAATLNRISSGNVELEGYGTYDFGDFDITGGNSTTSDTYNSAIRVTYGDGWFGTVKFGSGSAFEFQNLDLNAFANGGNSTIELAGVTGYLQASTSSTKTYEANFKLTGNGFTINNGYGGSKYKFTGDFGGSGNLTANRDLNNGLEFTFAGDMSQWTGELKHQQDSQNKYIYDAAEGVADTSIGNKLTAEGSGTTNAMNVVVKTAKDVTMAGELRAKNGAIMNVTKENNGDLAIKSLAVEGTGLVKVNGLSISATDSAAATSGAPAGLTAKADTNGTLTYLAEEASFTIEDMTLTNTTVTAATVETKVKLQNVEGSTALLAKGAFTLHAAPTVGMAPTAENHGTLSYTNGLAIATDANASLTLNLDVVNAVAGDAHGTYDLTITLSGFGEGFTVTEGILDMVGFDSTSWLGQALVSQKAEYTVVTEQTPATTGEGGVPTVSYAAGTGASVGSLVITITGLNVPEPATSTLSLLALAALAARRRRK